MESLLSKLPGYPQLSAEEKDHAAIQAEMQELLSHARSRLESVELLTDSSLRDSRLLAEYLHKDLEHLAERLSGLAESQNQDRAAKKEPEKASGNSTGWLSSLLARFQPGNPESLTELSRFYEEREESSSRASRALSEASARLDHLEKTWKSMSSSYLTSRDLYMKRIRRIAWITLTVVILGLFAGYRIYRDQPDQKFHRKHLQPLKSVLDPATYESMEGLAGESREDFLRVEDLIKIRVGLETFKNARGRFPGSRGELFSSKGERGPDWIPEIRQVVPVALPQDRRSGSDPSNQYLYISDGSDYKLLAGNPENCDAVKKWLPDLVDPVRGCDAIGYWTEGARQF